MCGCFQSTPFWWKSLFWNILSFLNSVLKYRICCRVLWCMHYECCHVYTVDKMQYLNMIGFTYISHYQKCISAESLISHYYILKLEYVVVLSNGRGSNNRVTAILNALDKLHIGLLALCWVLVIPTLKYYYFSQLYFSWHMSDKYIIHKIINISNLKNLISNLRCNLKNII